MERIEVIKILKLVSEGKVTPEQGTDLLEEFLGEYSTGSKTGILGKKIRIEVYNKIKDAQEVSLTVPLRLAGFVTKFLKGKTSNMKIGDNEIEMDVEEILEEIKRTNEPIEINTEEYLINIRVDS